MWKIPSRTRNQKIKSVRMNRRKKGDGDCLTCVICGLSCPNPKVEVHLGNGGSHLVTADEAKEDPAGDMYWYPIGPECWKKYKDKIWMYSSEAEKGPPKKFKSKRNLS